MSLGGDPGPEAGPWGWGGPARRPVRWAPGLEAGPWGQVGEETKNEEQEVDEDEFR